MQDLLVSSSCSWKRAPFLACSRLGHLLTAPASKSIYGVSRAVVLELNPGSRFQYKCRAFEVMYRCAVLVASLSLLIITSPLTLIGVGLRTIGRIGKKEYEVIVLNLNLTDKKISEISLVTFNMGLLADCASIRNHLSPANPRSSLITNELFNGLTGAFKEAPDIILGQEVFHTQASEKIGKDLAKMGYQVVVHDIGNKATSLNSGLFLASRCPLSNVEFMQHPYASSNTEKYASKGVLFAKAMLGDKKLVIVNTHLNGGAKGGGRYPRLAQINSLNRELNRYIRENFSKNEILDGVIVSGDMNISPFARDKGEKRQYLKQLGIDLKDEPLYDIIDPEWSFYSLLQGDEVTDEEIKSFIENSKCLPEHKINEILSLIKEIKALEPKDPRSKNRKDWEAYIHRSKLLYNQILPVAVLKSEDQTKLFGGPLSGFYFESEISKVKDALLGSSRKLEKDYMHLSHDQMIENTNRLDYHLVRNKRGFKDMLNFKVPIHLETKVIKIEKNVSDHYPVYTRFSV